MLESIWKGIEEPLFYQKLEAVNIFFISMKDNIQNKFRKSRFQDGNKECKKYILEAISYTEKMLNEIKKFYVQLENSNVYRFNIELGKIFKDLQQFQKKNKYYLSYNGIIIPNGFINEDVKYKYQDEKCLRFGIMIVIIALSNELRPQLNVSRTYVNQMEWNVYTNINVTIKKFFQELKIFKIKEAFGILNSHPSYKDVLKDKYMQDEWKKFEIINTTEGNLSSNDIYIRLNKGFSVVAQFIHRLYSTTNANFFTVCSYTLLQQEFDIRMKVSDKQSFEGKCSIKLLGNKRNSYYESYYAPLFFADFEDDKYNTILCFYNSPLNRHHPFSRWLLSATSDLYENYRGFFNAIIMCFENLTFQNGRDIAERLNSILQQLKKVAPELAIDESLIINSSSHKLY